MAFQFVRIELFSRKGKEGRGTGFVFDEVARVPYASIHVQSPGTPIVAHGLAPEVMRSLHDERAAEAKTEIKGGKVRAIRQDQNTLAGIVLSYPVAMEEYRAKPEVVARVLEWERRSIAWLRGQFGDRLVSVIRHEDESHPHLHAYILPDDPAMIAAHLHPGFRAKAAVKAAGGQPGEDDKALSKRADAEYKAAMRAWLDDYHAKVAQPCGMTRLGPGKRRLTREQWHLEKRQAEALRDTLAKAEVLKVKGDVFVGKVKEETAAMRAEAVKATETAQAAIISARAAEKVARQREEAARTVTAQAERDTRSAKRLSGLGGLLRSFWDGLQKSAVAARIRKAVESEVEELRRAAANAANRASAAEKGRREAEARARNLRDNLTDTGRQLAKARQELATLRPCEPAAALTQPRP